MTDLRTAAQQALEALELGYDSAKAEADQYHAAMAGYRPQRHAQMDADVQKIAAAITALKAALAEPVQEPVWVCPDSVEHRYQKPGHCEDCGKTLVQVTEPVQEPVAWRWGYRSVTTGEMDWRGYVEIAAHPNLRSPAIIMEPLYTSPPQRKPLTEDEIALIVADCSASAHRHDDFNFARAIERAHGIGGQP